jgi:outer membrane protein
MRMKNILISLFVLTFILAGNTLKAQSPKIGHINMQELIAAMPESDSANANLQKMTKEMQTNYQQMQADFNKKYEEYTKNSKVYNDLVRSTKEAELQDINKRMQAFQTNAQQKIQEQNQQLLKPILDKANKTIAYIAKENKFTYVLDTSQGVVIYTGVDAIDLMPMAKKKLGLGK